MSYPGAKAGSGVYQAIINQMPPHDVYVEPFLGSGAVMRRKRPARVNIGCDLDERVTDGASSLVRSGGWISGGGAGGAGGSDGARSSYYFHCQDGLDYLRRASHRLGDLVYLDPPYLMSTRRQHRRLYRCELPRARHVELIEVCRRLPAFVMVSGYRSELYDRGFNGWRRIDYQVQTHGGPATESLWTNYPEPEELHDYRYLGRDYRERERIHRQQARWQRRLLAMPDVERRAMVAALAAALAESGGGGPVSSSKREAAAAIATAASAGPDP